VSEDYRYSNKGPFYRNFLAGDNVWCEVNRDGQGGLWFHIGNSFEGHPAPESKPIHFSSEAHFMEFCTKLMGLDSLEDYEEMWMKHG
jgi:hypothetical protein